MLILVAGTFALQSSYSRADSPGGPLGVGIVLGDPSGFSARYWTTKTHSLDMSLAYSFDSFFILTGDYKLNFPHLFRSTGEHLHPYVGLGGAVAFSTDGTTGRGGFYGPTGSSFGLGLRVPFGIEWILSDSRLGVFLELVPGLGMIPSTFGFFEGGVGIRYYLD